MKGKESLPLSQAQITQLFRDYKYYYQKVNSKQSVSEDTEAPKEGMPLNGKTAPNSVSEWCW